MECLIFQIQLSKLAFHPRSILLKITNRQNNACHCAFMQIFRGRSWVWDNSPSLLTAMHPKTRRLTAHVAKACVSLLPVYLACIHMQILIDITTFTYCIFALGHILARQFPIVGFRPPVRLIDIIGRAADTRLHFYLHTFSALLELDAFFQRRSRMKNEDLQLHWWCSNFTMKFWDPLIVVTLQR